MLPFKPPVAFGFRIKQYLASPPITLIDQALKTMQSLALVGMGSSFFISTHINL